MEELACYLRESGLSDTSFWIPLLEERQVKSKAAFQKLEGNDDFFRQLEMKARSSTEKAKLRKSLKMDKKQEDERKKVKEQEKEWEIITELHRLESEGKNRQDEKVRKLESDLRDVLQIPLESWISKDLPFDEFLRALSTRYETSGQQVLPRTPLSDSDLIQRASGGRALQGVLLTKDLEDQLKCRSHLLKVPESVSLITLDEEESLKPLSFSSAQSEDDCKKSMDVLGFSIAGSAGIPLYGHNTVSLGASEMIQQPHVKESYSSKVKFSTIKLASFSFEKADFILSDEAMGDLKKISIMLQSPGHSSAVYKACEQFFHKYGSHVNSGPLVFGGSYCWICSSKNFSEEEEEVLEKVRSSAISATSGDTVTGVSASSKTNFDKIKITYEGKCSESALANTQLFFQKNGGPPEASDISQWRRRLVANNSTWSLIDRGSKLIAVWDIIKKNYEQDLKPVRVVLQETWEKMTGLVAELDLPKLYDPEEVLHEVSQWDIKNLSFKQVEDNLRYLLIVSKASPYSWISDYLSKMPLQHLLKSLVDSYQDTPHSEHIKLLARQLAEKEALSKLNAHTFPGIDKVAQWLYEPIDPAKMLESVVDFESFEVLKSFIEFLLSTDEEVIVDISSAVRRLRSHYKQTYDDVLIAILTSPFKDAISDDVLRPITLSELYSLQQILQLERVKCNEYCKNQNFLHLQAHLFKLAIDQASKPWQLLKDIEKMIDSLQPPTFEEINHIYLDSSTVSEFGERLDDLIMTSIAHASPASPAISASDVPHLETDSEIPHPAVSVSDAPHLETDSEIPHPAVSVSDVPHLETDSEIPHPAVSVSDAPHLETDSDIPHPAVSVSDALHLETDSEIPHPAVSVSDAPHLETDSEIPQQVEEKHEENSSVCEQAYEIFKKLGLYERYNKPLQLQDALRVTTEPLDFSLSEKELSDPKKLPYLVLHKIMSYDSLCRSDLMSSTSFASILPSLTSALCNSGSNTDVSPVDSLLALILCSDDFLRQDIFSRLAKCQLSVPFILPNPFTKQLTIPLWAMRSIIKEWKCSGGIVEQTHSIVSKEMPIVSFMRFSKQKHSKSGILNKVVSTKTSQYDHFFHYQCDGGQHKVVLGDGMVDMCWYLPSGQRGDKFPDAVTFLNLHGDARDYPQQVKFLSKISSTCLILISKEDMENDQTLKILKSFALSPGGFILLSEDSASLLELKKKLPSACLLALTDHTRLVAEGIVHLIKLNLKKVSDFKSIEYAVEHLCEFVVDENSIGERGLRFAKQVMKILASAEDTSHVSEQVLPLQGSTMWKLWASKNREMHRQKQRDGKTLKHSIAGIQTEMEQIRREQLWHNNRSLSPLMKSFVESLLQLQQPSRNYFLQSLKLELNKRSMDRLCRLGDDYQSTKNELQENKDESLFKKLKKLEKEIIDLSFGLEHLLREVSQLYEAALAVPSEPGFEGCDYEQFPRAAAELLIDGWPVEVMDGDAAHVPLEWVSAVLQEAAKILNDPKVFVLSVVGLQSTGKSTMLNTVFGLKFNVSAGRCTRGAFMQLLPLDEDLKEETKCSYVLVVDTEGLRAPTRDPSVIHEHDNMLATFVIGLADMTFINIMGETPGDMNDILQTSVHGFVRMKLATQKFSPSCQFIHQNTGKNVQKEVGDSQIAAKLDECTKLAAEQEQCVGEYKCFKDVIQFDGQTDVHHFPGLLKGGPPMAPIDEEYSSAAQKLKQHFIKYLHKKAKSSSGCGLTFSLLHTKISDLWFSLLEENFVFSFKNTMEIIAYKTLETEWSRSWRWPFCDKMLTWEKNAENKITAADSVQSVSEVVKKKRVELANLVNETKSEIKRKMKKFFDSKQNDQLEPWRGKFQHRLEILSDDLQQHAERHVIEIGENRKPIFGYGKDQEKYMKIVRRGVSEHIEQIKSSGVQLGPKPDHEAVLKAEFDGLWEGLMQDIPSTLAKISSIEAEVEAEVEAKLLDFKSDYRDKTRQLLIKEPLTKRGPHLKPDLQEGKHFKIAGVIQRLFGSSPLDPQVVNNMTGRILDAARQHLEEKRAEKHNFHPGLVENLLHFVDNMIDEESRKIEDTITLKSRYRIEVFVTICCYAIPVFQKMAVSFKERTDPRLHLERNVKHILLRQFNYRPVSPGRG